jgi:hypothetical protein
MFVFFLKQVEPYYLLFIGMLLARPILGSMRIELNTSVFFKDNRMGLIDKVKVFGVDFQVVKFIEVLQILSNSFGCGGNGWDLFFPENVQHIFACFY